MQLLCLSQRGWGMAADVVPQVAGWALAPRRGAAECLLASKNSSSNLAAAVPHGSMGRRKIGLCMLTEASKRGINGVDWICWLHSGKLGMCRHWQCK
jgi:hypothetical protein